jgi:hypothetical protein
MTELLEALTVDYFELNGFMVRKHLASSGMDEPGHPAYEVRNLREDELEEEIFFEFQWFSSDVLRVRRAVVTLVHVAMDGNGLRQAVSEKRWFQAFKRMFQGKRAMCLPWEREDLKDAFAGHRRLVLMPFLPRDPFRGECVDLLRERQVEGVLTYRTILDGMLQHLLSSGGASLRSPRLQLLQLLLQMDLLKSPQMDLFERA